MPNAHDIAAFIMKRSGPMTAMKLQKLVYYSQAWSLVWDEKPLFNEQIEAWAAGPVVPALYKEHRGCFRLEGWSKGDPSKLTQEEADTVEAVLKFYGDKTSQWLSDLTHTENPWRDARAGTPLGAPCNNIISHAAMSEYYGSLLRWAARNLLSFSTSLIQRNNLKLVPTLKGIIN